MFGVEVAVVISLMFVTLLLAAGMLALEREEHAFGRLVRGLVSRTGLLVEKIGLAALCALGAGGGDARRPRRVPRPRLGPDAGVAARARRRRARVRGAGRRDRRRSTREVRAASLLAFMLALPIAALALVPSGAVDGTLYDVIRIVSGAFPFKPALDALDAALSGGDLLAPLLHLAALTSASPCSRASRCAGSPRSA